MIYIKSDLNNYTKPIFRKRVLHKGTIAGFLEWWGTSILGIYRIQTDTLSRNAARVLVSLAGVFTSEGDSSESNLCPPELCSIGTCSYKMNNVRNIS